MSFKNLVLPIIGIISFISFYYYACQFFPGMPGYHRFHYHPNQYLSDLQKISESKMNLQEEFDATNSQEDVLRRAKFLFEEKLTETVFPYWLGTDYDFYGQTQIPGKGQIACGYFVSTVLEDMGIELDRVGLARMASEQMIKTLVQSKYIKRYSNQSIKRMISDIEFEGDGIYVIGLDTHTGFLVRRDDLTYFVHASGRNPWEVIEEPAIDSRVLNESAYRVTGNLTKDSTFLQRWLSN